MAFTYIVPYAEEAGNVSNTANITINNANVTNNANVGNNLTTSNLFVTNTANIANLNANGNVSFTGANISLGSVGNLHITGGTANYFLQTDGAGNLTWATAGGNTSNISNGTSNVSIATSNGNITMSVNGTSNVVVISDTNINVSGNINASNANLGNLVTANFYAGNGSLLTGINGGNVSNVANANYANFAGTLINGNSNISIQANSNVSVSVGGTSNVIVATTTGANINGTLSITGNISGSNANLGNLVIANYYTGSGNNLSNIQAANITGTVANANYALNAGNTNLANYVIQASQPNITSLGTLATLTVNGISNFNATTNFTNNAIFTGSNTYISNVSNLHIPGGTNGYFLQTDGAGNLNWVNGTTTGNGVVGGSNTQVQYNNAGNFGGSAGLTFDSASNTLTTVNLVVTGNLTATINTPTTSSNIFITKGQSINVYPYLTTINVDVLNGTVIYNSNAYIGSNTANTNINLAMFLNFRGNSTTSLNSLMNIGDKITIIFNQKLTMPISVGGPWYMTGNVCPAPNIKIDGSNIAIVDGFANRTSVENSDIYFLNYGNIIISPTLTQNQSTYARFGITIYKTANTPKWSGYWTPVSF